MPASTGCDLRQNTQEAARCPLWV